MPRDPQLYPMTPNQSLVRELDSLEARIAQLRGRTTVTAHQTAPGSIDDPLEGEVIIDPTDDKIKWYSGGEWRLCTCGPVVANDGVIILDGYRTSAFEYSDIFMVDISVPSVVPITDGPLWGWFKPVWWNSEKTQLMAMYDDPDGPMDIYRMNADGSNLTKIYDTIASSQGQLQLHTRGDSHLLSYTTTATAQSVRTIDLDTGTMIGEVTNAILPSGWGIETASNRLSPLGDKYLICPSNHPVTPRQWRVYSVDIDGSNLVNLNLEGGTGSANDINSFPPYFSPDQSRVAYYHSGFGIGMVNADGTGKGIVYPISSTFFHAWSNDGSLFGFIYFNGSIYRFRAIDTTTYLPVYDWPVTTFGGWDWSPDDSQIILAISNATNAFIEVLTLEDGSVDRIYDAPTTYAYWNIPGWSRMSWVK